MPFVFNFDWAISDVKSVEVNPKGWKCPVTVEYAVAQAHKYDTTLSVVWRVKGTTHTFTIGEQKLNILSHGNYKKHFEEVLENFKTLYLTWFTDPDFEKADWKYEYKQQFEKLFEKGDNN